MIGSEQRNKEAEDNEEMIEGGNQAYPQCKTTFAQKVRMSCIYGQATGDQMTSLMWEDSLIDKEAKKFLKKK
jgi:hypothetical protein